MRRLKIVRVNILLTKSFTSRVGFEPSTSVLLFCYPKLRRSSVKKSLSQDEAKGVSKTTSLKLLTSSI